MICELRILQRSERMRYESDSRSFGLDYEFTALYTVFTQCVTLQQRLRM